MCVCLVCKCSKRFSSSSSSSALFVVAASTIFLNFCFTFFFGFSFSLLLYANFHYSLLYTQYFPLFFLFRSQRFSFAFALFSFHHATQKLITIIYGNFVCSLNELHFFRVSGYTHFTWLCCSSCCCCCCCCFGCCTS